MKFRIRKRALESRERRLLSAVSSVYGFDIFLCCNTAFAPFMDDKSPRSAIMTLAAGGVFIALIFALVVYRIWRNPPPSALLIAIPGLVFTIPGVLLISPLLTLFSICNAAALVALYSLHGTWKELAKMSAHTSGIGTPSAGVSG